MPSHRHSTPGAPAATARRARRDGWTAERQHVFIATLADSGSVVRAAHVAGIDARSAYRLRDDPRGHDFAQAWDAALSHARAARRRPQAATPISIEAIVLRIVATLDPALFDAAVAHAATVFGAPRAGRDRGRPSCGRSHLNRHMPATSATSAHDMLED